MRAVPSRRSRLAKLGAASLVLATSVAGLTSVTGGAAQGAAPRVDRADLKAAPTQPTLTGRTGEEGKAPSSSLARTPKGLKTLTSAKRIPVMIKYDYDALASYRGTVPGYAATSPSVTNKPLKDTTTATTRYRGYLRQQERRISGRVEAAVPSAAVGKSYRTVYGGVSAVVPGNTVKQLLQVPGVVAVQRDSVEHPLTDSSSDFINAQAAYRALRSKPNAGAGVLFGDLDTGIWPEHPSFADQGNLPAYDGPALPCDYGDNPLTPAADPFQCNNKLVGGRAFLATNDAINGTDYAYPDTARDADGHGSHTSGTSAGNVVDDVQTIGPKIDQINGMAPGAQVIEYRVCVDGCYTSDSAAAVQQAILDGVDVINFSISGGTNPLTDPVELAFLDAYNAGVFVAASAGNEGPSAGTANHLSPWVTSVAASTQEREFASTLTLTAADGATFTSEGSSIMPGAGPLPVVLASAPPYSDITCGTPAPAGLFTGKIVVCERGGTVNGAAIGRVQKGYNLRQGGAAGMILYNPVLADTETDNHWLPAIHLADGTDMLAFVAAHPGALTGQFTDGTPKQGRGDVMAAFSSRGPAGSFVKPDITAPGVQILAAHTPTPDNITVGPPGQYYQAIAGTSMSSPHIAGSAILIKAVHPDWTPGQIKSAMMTQAKTTVVKEDLTTPADPFDMGAGRIDVGRAISAPLTISDSGADMLALSADPVHAIDVNIPSINAPVMPGRVTTTRTVTNVTGRTLTVTPGATTSGSTRISFSPRSARVAPGASRAFQVTISSSAPTGEQQFATVLFRTRAGTAHLPVAFVPSQGSVSLAQSCDPATVARGATTTCTVTATNDSFTEQDVSMTTGTNARLRVVGADGATVSGGRARASATLAGADLGVPSIAPGTSPAGFLPLADFGIGATPIGDEDQLQFDVPAFVYNGRTENHIAVDSNGYLVVAGQGASTDNECCTIPSGASPAAPNNILAPFWTDLNGEGADGIYAGTLTDGVNTWLVVEWDVNVYGTTDTRHFQTWIGLNGAQDISYTYGEPQTDPGQPYLVAAENAAGEGDGTTELPSADLVVTSTDPAPGASLSYDVTVRGVSPGAGVVHSEMTASDVSGTTVVDTRVPVTR